MEPKDITQNVGNKLRQIRESHGLSLHQASMNYARITGRDPETSDTKGYISKIENGALLPRRTTLLALGQAVRGTGQEVNELLQTGGYLPNAGTSEDAGLAARGVVKAVRPELSPEALDKIAEVVREITAKYEILNSQKERGSS